MPRNGYGFKNDLINKYVDMLMDYSSIIRRENSYKAEQEEPSLDEKMVFGAIKNLFMVALSDLKEMHKNDPVEEKARISTNIGSLMFKVGSYKTEKEYSDQVLDLINSTESKKLGEFFDSNKELLTGNGLHAVLKYITDYTSEKNLVKESVNGYGYFTVSNDLLHKRMEELEKEKEKNNAKEVKVEKDPLKTPVLEYLVSDEELNEFKKHVDELGKDPDVKFGRNLDKVKEHTKQYEILSNYKKNANRFEFDKDVIDETFGSLEPNSYHFEDRFREVAARLAKGEVLFKLQDKIDLRDDYKKSSRFLYDMLKAKGAVFEIGKLENVANKAENEYKDLDTDDIDFNIGEREKIANLFKGCKSLKDYQKTYEKTFDKILSGKMTITGIENYEKDIKSLSNVVDVLTEMVEKSTDCLKYGNLTDFGKKIVEKNLDGVKLSRNMLEKFNDNLGKKRLDSLSQDEMQYANIDDKFLNDNEKELKTIAERKLNYVKTSKDNDVLDGALATYARMKEIHSKRGMFFFLFHPKQNGAENNAISTMESTLKKEYKFTDAELADIVREKGKNSTDEINLWHVNKSLGENVKTNLLEKEHSRKEMIQEFHDKGKLPVKNNEKASLEDRLSLKFGTENNVKTVKNDLSKEKEIINVKKAPVSKK